MAISGKYGKINIPKVGEQEPVFVLRAQDRLAVYAIEMYHLLTASHGASVSGSIADEITSFRHWQGRKKCLTEKGSEKFWVYSPLLAAAR